MGIDRRRLENHSQERTKEYLRRASVTYLECCVSLMLTHLPREEVVEILEQEAHLVREFD
ncbi:hypothetical protein [Mesorhizobium sp. SP-1A]|uniref:hypothetical protein n=1 Tax=Mesorhizobium sp. SP-1A TaxID=3077840 RepID=UPI0028F6F719|nr:hypothetical protein [Mesorhizobium sp. SP-1A]